MFLAHLYNNTQIFVIAHIGVLFKLFTKNIVTLSVPHSHLYPHAKFMYNTTL